MKGRASHAGLDPEAGINATVERAHQVIRISEMGDAEAGTTVTPTVGRAGSTGNTVPAEGLFELDVRAWTAAAGRLGLPAPAGVTVGGASDGNFTAALGVPTLDRLGPTGGGAHADREHVIVGDLPSRTALAAEIIRSLCEENPGG